MLEDGPLPDRARVVAVVTGVAVIAALDFALGMRSPAAQVAHIVVGALYLAPILAAATWFGSRGGIACAMATASLRWLHVETAWPPDLLLDATQAIQASTFVVIAAVVGVRAEPTRGRPAERKRLAPAETGAERVGPPGDVGGDGAVPGSLPCRGRERHARVAGSVAV